MVPIGRTTRNWLHKLALGGLAALTLAAAQSPPKVQQAPEQQKTAPDPRGAGGKLPAPRQVQPPPPPQPKTKPAAPQPKGGGGGIELGSWPDWVIVAFTAFLAWLSWRQHVLEKKLAADAGNTLAIAKQSADAATATAEAAAAQAAAFAESNQIAREIGKIQTRPYLIIDKANVEIAVGQHRISNVMIRVPMKNYGTTPAVGPNIATNCRIYFEDGGGTSYTWASPLVRYDEIFATVGPGAEYTGTWLETVIDASLEGPTWEHDRPQFSLSDKISDPATYPIGVMVDVLFTYLNVAGEVQASEYYRLDANVEANGVFFPARVLRVKYDPQGAGDIYPIA